VCLNAYIPAKYKLVSLLTIVSCGQMLPSIFTIDMLRIDCCLTIVSCGQMLPSIFTIVMLRIDCC
jgi:hypothetical protein